MLVSPTFTTNHEISMFFHYIAGQGSPKNDILSGLTVALALVPEAVAFAFVAGVDPLVGLYAAFLVGLIMFLSTGRKIRLPLMGFASDFAELKPLMALCKGDHCKSQKHH